MPRTTPRLFRSTGVRPRLVGPLARAGSTRSGANIGRLESIVFIQSPLVPLDAHDEAPGLNETSNPDSVDASRRCARGDGASSACEHLSAGSKAGHRAVRVHVHDLTMRHDI